MPTIRFAVPRSSWPERENVGIVANLIDDVAAIDRSSGKGEIERRIAVHIAETSEGGRAMVRDVVG